MVLFSLIAIAFMAGSAHALAGNPYVYQIEYASCEVAASGYFREADDSTLDTKKMSTVCYTLGQDYNVNDRITWTLTADSGSTTFQDPGEYFLVTQRDESNAPLAWSCNVWGDAALLTLRKAWNAQAIPTGKNLSTIEFRAIAGSGAGFVKRNGVTVSAYQAGIQWCLAHECDFNAVNTSPLFLDDNNIAVDTKALANCCNRYYITERSDQWLVGGGYIEFDKKGDQTKKISEVMASKRQFVGTKSDVNDLFDEQIYCPDRRYFASGQNCDTYTKIICGTTEECGQEKCSWDTGFAITNVYTLADGDVLTMTIQATATSGLDSCITPSLTGDFSGYSSQCDKNANGFYCWLYGSQIKAVCPSFPTTSCAVQMELCTDGSCQMNPRWFKNIKDEFLMTGGNQDIIWDITPKSQFQYAGIWIVNGTQFIVPYLTSINGYGTNCFLNSKAISTTAAWVDIFAMQSCDGAAVTDGCFAKLLGVTNIPIGAIQANAQKRFDFTNTSLVPYVRNAGNTGETADGALTFNFTANGVVAGSDRFAALVTVCNLDQYVGWKQGNSAPWDNYTNDWAGVQNLGDPTPNSSLSCVQSQPGGAKRTLPILTPLGMVWK